MTDFASLMVLPIYCLLAYSPLPPTAINFPGSAPVQGALGRTQSLWEAISQEFSRSTLTTA